MEIQLNVFSPGAPQPTILVASHERSGTHFLMNSMAKGFGYRSENWIDLDWNQIPINYYAEADITGFVAQFAGKQIANPFKSHHQADFFAPVIGTVLKSMRILYIYRHPWDVMQSYRRLINRHAWREGRKCETASELLHSAPEGHLMRYQMLQHPTMLHRWKAHVSGWMDLADRHDGVLAVQYERLRDDYASVLEELGGRIAGMAPLSLEPPDKTENVITPREAGDTDVPLSDEDAAFIDKEAGDLMQRLGYA